MKTAVIFPGQGSQFVGMGKDLFENFPKAKAVFNRADSFLEQKISEVCFFGPQEKLKDTLLQQLAIFLVSALSWDIFKSKIDITPLFFAGLSLGEYTSLYASEALSFQDSLFLVKERAELMAQASKENPSCMFAVLGLNREDLEEFNTKIFYIANLNCPGQVVISLKKGKADKVRDILKRKGAKKIIELQVSGGFHSPFMQDAKDRLEKVVRSLDFKDAKVPIVSNVDGFAHTAKEEIRNNLIKQLTFPVLWWKSVEFMKAQGVELFYEIGPSKVLKGIIKKIDSSLKVINFSCVEDFNHAGIKNN